MVFDFNNLEGKDDEVEAKDPADFEKQAQEIEEEIFLKEEQSNEDQD